MEKIVHVINVVGVVGRATSWDLSSELSRSRTSPDDVSVDLRYH